MIENRIKQDIIEVGKRMFYKGFVASNDGNISARLSENEIIITPTGVSKGYMSVSDLIKVDMEGNVVAGSKKPSSEIKMHLAVYRKRPDVKAIVHAHPPAATAFAVANKGLDRITLPEVIFSLGSISMAEYGTPTTNKLPMAVEKHIGRSDALLLANHGALTVGKDVMDAYYKMETLEHFAQISVYARLLGGERVLDEEETRELFRVRKEVYGKDNPLCTNCGACTTGSSEGDGSARVQNNSFDIAREEGRPACEAGSREQDTAGGNLEEVIKRLVVEELKKLV
ncbi:MAG: class II aldolase/adducin family protein [Mahellales bacterium]|jgi:L-fuculose-phosphate aldolase